MLIQKKFHPILPVAIKCFLLYQNSCQPQVKCRLWRIFIQSIYSEKATKFCEIFTLLLSCLEPVKSKVKISQNFVAFSEYMNFTRIYSFFFFQTRQFFWQAIDKIVINRFFRKIWSFSDSLWLLAFPNRIIWLPLGK